MSFETPDSAGAVILVVAMVGVVVIAIDLMASDNPMDHERLLVGGSGSGSGSIVKVEAEPAADIDRHLNVLWSEVDHLALWGSGRPTAIDGSVGVVRAFIGPPGLDVLPFDVEFVQFPGVLESDLTCVVDSLLPGILMNEFSAVIVKTPINVRNRNAVEFNGICSKVPEGLEVYAFRKCDLDHSFGLENSLL